MNTVTSLTPTQKLHALAYKHFQFDEWYPRAGDYYTSARADLELYQVVEVTDSLVKTKYCDPERGDTISEWEKDKFLTEGYGPNRVYVPKWILKISDAQPAQQESQEDMWKDFERLLNEQWSGYPVTKARLIKNLKQHFTLIRK